MRCGLIDDYRVEVSGPHLKAICNGCDKYIKFLPKRQGEPVKPPTYKMGQIISVRIDVLKIDKARLYEGEKGTYLDITLLMKDQADAYGNHGMVVQQVTQEERKAGTKGAILGNAKIISGAGGNSEANPTSGEGAAANTAQPVKDKLPF